ncbi:hypothetical protein [Stappia sp. ES.058]|uniref:capsular polysaccharide export protein, LipB/KpsS family n=1 Tax=Stappia sp. ES.058 TaxID=1881061 RepID=UPI0012FE107B|nr:hypothetical protein [Stappia sp. ES.058]
MNDRALAFFDRKVPTGDKYPYEVHYAPALPDAPTGVEAFHLVGRAWRKTPEAPLALAFGFNAWKYGFMADYCPDVRIAFAPRKFLGWDAWRAAKTMQPAPSRIYVWGYTDPGWLARFARKKGIPLIRVEDGFLRSAELGASHATPYSLVFDSKGLYYNAGEPNDLADILASHDFAGDTALMENARSALDLLIEKRLSKYNLPDVGDPARHFSVKTRRRVLVLGQVDNDAAVRMGNSAGWRMGDIVRLAKLENPDAEILYRPHPDIYHGYQRSKFKAERIEKFARIVSPDGPLIDMLETVDHVYTLSSLSGLEALLRGLTVTTLGTPFYAGWGLTDDRTQKHRGRNLTVLELFAGVYLKYPTYLADVTENYLGLQAAAFRITGDRALLQIERSQASDHVNSSILDLPPIAALTHLRGKSDISSIAALRRMIVSPEVSPLATLTQIIFAPKGSFLIHEKKFSSKIIKIFVENKGPIFHRATATIIAAKLDIRELVPVLGDILPYMDRRSANSFLLDLYRHRPEINTASLFSKLAEESHNRSLSLELYEIMSQGVQKHSSNLNGPDNSETTTAIATDPKVCRDRASLLLNNAEFSVALDEICAATIIDGQCNSLIEMSAEVAWQLFDFHSAHSLAQLGMHILGPQTAWALKLYWKTCPYVSFDHLFDEAALCASIRPNMIPIAIARLDDMEGVDTFGMANTTLLKSHRLAFKLDIPYVQTLLEIGHFEDALDIIHAVASDSQSYQSAVATSRCLTYLDRYAEAESLIDRTLATYKNKLVYDEALKICLYTGNYLKADRLLSEASGQKIDLGQTLPCKIALGTHRYADGFRTYREVGVSKDLARAFPQKHISNSNYSYEGKSITLLPIYGPGDEIRFASTYNTVKEFLKFEEISIGVEPRLFNLFQRSFTESGIKFFPTQRILRNERVLIDRYDKLPFADLMSAMDNHAADYCDKSTSVGLVTDLLADLLKDSSDFSGSAYLKADPLRSKQFRSQLPSSGPLVGLNWRSSVTLQSRQEHYLSVDDLMPLFESTNAQFVNLQYDDCTEELAFIEKKFPGRLLNLRGLDQYNDLDGVASLISCLDLVIAPCTTVAELSGALGQETLLLANSSEIEWRVRKNDNSDIWHNSIEHIFGERYRDKSSLVLALIERLNAWLSRV